MKVVTRISYQCEVCGTQFSKEDDARECEARPVKHDRGVKIGDVVKITHGQGTGQLAKVDAVIVTTKEYGHYEWERYWHTVAVTAKLIDDWGSRFLVYDSYETVP